MSLPATVALSGIGGVTIVMLFLLFMVSLSSKIAMAIEKKTEK